MSDKDVDAQFADIIAHWNDVTDEPDRGPTPPGPGVPPGDPAAGAATAQPSAESSPADSAPTDGSPAGASPGDGNGRPATPHSPPTPPEPSPAPTSSQEPRPRPRSFRFEGGASTPGEPVDPPPSWRSPEPADEPEEHFRPGPTAPLPAGDLQFWGILAGLVGGPLMLVYLVLFNREGHPLWMLAAVGITVAGFGLLVQRLPKHRDEDDDGAIL